MNFGTLIYSILLIYMGIRESLIFRNLSQKNNILLSSIFILYLFICNLNLMI
jgi:hypothetical protein